MDQPANVNDLPILSQFKGKIDVFKKNVNQVVSKKNCPAWFGDFCKYLDTFVNEVADTVAELEGQLAIQKAVTDGLAEDRKRLQKKIDFLEDELEDQRQYSRRTNLLFHGLDEDPKEKTDDKVLEIMQKQLELPEISLKDVSRTHRLGPKKDGKKRPIIVRFASYRERKMVFDAKKN